MTMDDTQALVLSEIPFTCEDLRRRWIAAFCPQLSRSLKSPDYKPVLWSVFSSDKVSCLNGEAAKGAFQAAAKEKLYVFYEYDGGEENALVLTRAAGLGAKDLEDENDIYLMPPDFSWTYVQTHEDGFGPYFCRSRSGKE